jgi:hypothetical protein
MILLVAAALALALLAAASAGGRASEWAAARSKPDPDGAGRLLSGALGLLALLIGFTFALSAERFETRRELVVAEANALSTTYLRDSLFSDPFGARLDALLARYGEARLDFFAAGRDRAGLAAVARRTGALQDEIWRETAAALGTPGNGPFATPVLNATNELFDLAASGQAARITPVPAAVLWLLVLSAMATAALCGYTLRLGVARHGAAVATFLALVAMSIVLILDLDWPTEGLIVVPQGPLNAAVANLRAHELHRQAFTLPDGDATSGAGDQR